MLGKPGRLGLMLNRKTVNEIGYTRSFAVSSERRCSLPATSTFVRDRAAARIPLPAAAAKALAFDLSVKSDPDASDCNPLPTVTSVSTIEQPRALRDVTPNSSKDVEGGVQAS